jgi:hypothetical protein
MVFPSARQPYQQQRDSLPLVEAFVSYPIKERPPTGDLRAKKRNFPNFLQISSGKHWLFHKRVRLVDAKFKAGQGLHQSWVLPGR